MASLLFSVRLVAQLWLRDCLDGLCCPAAVLGTFAHQALALGQSRAGWLAAFGACGSWRPLESARPCACRHRKVCFLSSRSRYPLWVLAGLASIQIKLASGLFVGVALVGGLARETIVCWLRQRLSSVWVVVVGAAVLAVALGTGSLAMNLLAIRLKGPALLDPELISTARAIPIISRHRPPVVLTDSRVGNILPGLIGARVWAGHWAITDRFAAKQLETRRAGLDPEFPPDNSASLGHPLLRIVTDTRFDYALLDQRCARAIEMLKSHGWTPFYRTEHWMLLRAPSSRLAPVELHRRIPPLASIVIPAFNRMAPLRLTLGSAQAAAKALDAPAEIISLTTARSRRWRRLWAAIQSRSE